MRVTKTMVQHARKVVADAQRAIQRSSSDGPSPLAEEMMRKRDEFERTGKVTIHEDGKTAVLTRIDNGLRIVFVERKGARPQTMTFSRGDDGRWFEENFPKHARV